MKTILIVGIGTGNPEHLTVQAINALNRADVLFIPTREKAKSISPTSAATSSRVM
jgi:precorrin-6A synthase